MLSINNRRQQTNRIGTTILTIFFTAATLTASLSPDALGQTNGTNIAETIQIGDDHKAATSQTSPRINSFNLSRIEQLGTRQDVSVEQEAYSFAENTSEVRQTGENGKAEIIQRNMFGINRSLVEQNGTGNTVSLLQAGDGAANSQIIQVGIQNDTTLFQSHFTGATNSNVTINGSNNQTIFEQYASRGGATSTIDVTGDNNLISGGQYAGRGFGIDNVILLSGNANTVSFIQSGEFGNNSAIADISGSSNLIQLFQKNAAVDSAVNDSLLEVTGDNNLVDIQQGTESRWGTGFQSASSAIRIDGSANTALLLQTSESAGSSNLNVTGNGNAVSVTQR